MSSRRSVRQLLVGVLIGVLVGGGLMAVTPAGASVNKAVATSWKKIWKKELKPLADKRYYQKSQTDTKYASKADAAAAAAAAQSAATSAANAATDSKLGGYYRKGESDAKYAPNAPVLRGTYALIAGRDDYGVSSISLGQGFSTAPTTRYISVGEALPAGCSGSAAAPNAAPGYLCVFETYASTGMSVSMCRSAPVGCDDETADPFGTALYMETGAAPGEIHGTWVARPTALAAATLPRIGGDSVTKASPAPALR